MGGAAGESGLCRTRVWWSTVCAGIAGCSISTLGACGLSMLAGFFTLGTGGCNLGGRRSSYLSFFLGWGNVHCLGVVSTSQSLSVSCRDQRTRIWSPDQKDGAPWRAYVNCCSPWSNLSSGVTDGCVMWWCLNSIVSEIIIYLVSFGVTRWQQ